MNPRNPPRLFLTILLLLFLPLFQPLPAAGGGLEVERQLLHDLRQSKVLVRQMAALQPSGASVAPQAARLKGLAASLAARRQQLDKKIDLRRGEAERLGPTALGRHARMAERYQAKISEYLALVEALAGSDFSPLRLEELKSLLDSLAPEREQPLLGALPYRHLNLAGRQPAVTPAFLPAFLGGDQTVTGADLAGSLEAPVTAEIVALAESLGWNPVAIHGWVKNNIKTEWYWGSMKGAVETLRQGSGNDADQAALLVALLRAAGFPARFVRGAVEFFPGLSAAENLTGLSGGQEILAFFQKAGIPAKALIGGGKIANLQVEHIWVEAEIPYANYRGVVIDEHGKSWLGLDPSFKVGAIGENQPLPRPAGYDLNTFRQRYLAEVRSATPLEFLRGELVAAGAVYEDLLHTRTALPEELQILPASLQFKTLAVTGEFASLPAELRHRARFTATAGTTTFFDLTLPVVELASRRIAVIYEPVTVEDQEIINSYGGLSNTPAYLVRLRPVLTVDGERLAIGTGGLAVGEDFSLTVELLPPNGQGERLENRLTIGNIAVLGLAAQGVTLPTPIPLAEKSGERLLHERALDYLDRWHQAENELAALLGITIARPLPSLVTLGGVVEVVRLLDQPHGFDWKGVYLDADFRAVEGAGGTAEDYRLFLQLSGLQGSVLENRVFEDAFGVESVSTAKLLALSNNDGLPPLVLDQANLAAELPALALPANIEADLTHAVYQGQTVTIPPGQSSHEDWRGYGYLKEDPASGEAGWMLSGGIAGGMTALNPERWPVDYLELMSHPFRGPTNYDPAAASELKIVTAGDRQWGTAGQLLFAPLQVMAVDRKGTPVAGVTLNFSVKAGGGRLSAASATTDGGGIASVNLTLGQRIADNPTYMSGYPHSWLIGENIIEVVSSTGLRPRNPFTAYAMPGEAKLLTISGDQVSGEILSWSTTLIARVEDEYHNAISNVPVSFRLGEASPRASCVLANADTRKGALVATTDACLNNNIPALGDCGAESLAGQTSELGAVAQVILGGVPDADYPITIAAKGFPERVVTVTSRPFGNCNGETPPQHDLVLKDINLTDRFGTNLNAAGVGKSIPMLARMYAVSEEGQTVQKQSNCFPGDTATCPYFVGTRQYRVDTEFSAAAVTFADQTGVNLGAGMFRIENLAVGDSPGKRSVTITGRVSKILPETVKVCGRYDKCVLQDQERELPPIYITKEIFVVDIALPRSSYGIPVDSEGYALNDTVINYSILPAEYTAGSAMVEIATRKPDGSLEPQSFINSEANGAGFVTLARGFRFESGKEYAAQVILNYASTGGEIVSKEIRLIPYVIRIVSDDAERRDMLGAATDGVSTLRLRLEAKSGWELLPQLNWTIADADLPGATMETGSLLDGVGNSVTLLPVVFDVNGVAEAVYRVPQNFVRFGSQFEATDKARPKRFIQIRLGDPITGLPQITLKRPPVLLVHGLWGDGRKEEGTYTWKEFEGLLNTTGVFDIYSVNYHKSNADSIASNEAVVEENIFKPADSLNDLGYAASQVDIIAHSMGGLLVREYCRHNSSECAQNIRKFITIDTPHAGSGLAPILQMVRDRESAFWHPIEHKLLVAIRTRNCPSDNAVCRPLGGAIDDLVPGSAALKSLPELAIPTHIIASSATDGISGHDSVINNLWREGLMRVMSLVPDTSFPTNTGCGVLGRGNCQPVFSAEKNDRIVTLNSQFGGVGLGGQRTDVAGADHLSVKANDGAVRKTRELLDLPSNDVESFIQKLPAVQ